MRPIDADALYEKVIDMFPYCGHCDGYGYVAIESVEDLVKDAPAIVPKWLYRLESKSKENGLWYNSKGEMVWGIGKLPNCKTKDLPMYYDERYRKDGKHWFSSCSNKEDLMHWYSIQDALDLIENGFVFTRYLAVEYVEYELETTFIKESCLAREEISIEELFGKQPTIEQPQWISCAERLPEDGEDVLLYDRVFRFLELGTYYKKSKRLDAHWTIAGRTYPIDDYTHWMPLPEPPKGDE